MTDDSSRFIYGVNPVLSALRTRPEELERLFVLHGEIDKGPAGEIFARAKELNLSVQKLPRERLSAMAEGGVHQGIVAQVRQFTYSELSQLLELAQAAGQEALLVVLDGIQDPHNLGAIIRSAVAFGAQGILIPNDRAAHVTGTVAKASSGAIEHARIARVVNVSRSLEELKEAGFWTAVADPSGTQAPWDIRWNGPMALVIGAEGAGARPGVVKHCDFRVRIPIEGPVESLNASVAAGVLLYEIARARVSL